MGVMNLAKRLLSKEHRQFNRQVNELKALPLEEAYDKAGDMLHQLCIRHAAEFVKSEQVRDESPFTVLHEHDFFHEMLIVDLWMADKIFSKKNRPVAESLHKHYEKVFYLSGHADKSLQALREKFAMYTETWDDYTGHQDDFGLAVAKNLFGSREFRTNETSFWIIWHADTMKKKFIDIRRMMRNMHGKA